MEYLVLSFALAGLYLGFKDLRKRAGEGKTGAASASVGIDKSGQPIPLHVSLRSMQPWWLILLSFGLLFLSLSIILRG